MIEEQIDWQRRASMALDSAIASRHLISYAELADTAQIPPPHRIHKLTMWLETLVADEHQSARPLRAAWVVSRQRGKIPAPLPANGAQSSRWRHQPVRRAARSGEV